MTQVIGSFKEEYSFLSNFYSCQITVNFIVYPSVEHAYQAQKTNNKDLQEHISHLTTAYQAKSYGKHIIIRDDYEKEKLHIMEFLLQLKFNQAHFQKLLQDTGDAELIEGNYWHDNFWGICICDHCKDKAKHNHLGKLLMKIRNLNNWR